jgi:gamma-glutamyltranspeptidase/glutathione hydrolase
VTEARRFPNACVASPHYLASAAGLAVLAGGGNAVDAAVATNLTLGVVAPYLCGYGGDLFALVWCDGEPFGYNGSGRAPADASLDAVRAAVDGEAMPGFGPLTVTVPGAVEGWFALLDRFGSRSFEELARPALRLAEEGFPLTTRAAESLRRAAARYTWAPEWRRVYGGAVAGRRLRQPDLGRTIRELCAGGPDPYYRGAIARDITDHLRAQGGLIGEEDLAEHHGEWVDPIRTPYRDTEVLELPPNTQGVTALEAMAIVHASGPLPAEGPDRHHLLVEAAKLALADRDAHVTDPDHMLLAPEDLLSPAWIRHRAATIDPAASGRPAPGSARVGGTAYLCSADPAGLCVSLIQSNWTGFGSGITVPGWGINLQNRGAWFSLDPGHVNVIAPRKRTMHTLIPAMALRGGSPWLVFGSMGGGGQPQTHLQLVVRLVDDGLDAQEAVSAPRWVVSAGDWSVTIESRFDRAIIEGLRARGHPIEVTTPFDQVVGHAHAIEVTDEGYAAGSDPRAEGAALGL